MLAGDWHGNAAWAVRCIEHAAENGADVILQLGDFGFWNFTNGETITYLETMHAALDAAEIELYWIDGNHENHDLIAFYARDRVPWSLPTYGRIVHLPRGFRWQWWDQTWMALGGAHSVDSFSRTEGRSWWPAEHLSEEDVAYASQGKVDVLVAHDCPAGVNIPGIYPPGVGKQEWPLNELVRAEEHRESVRRVVQATQPSRLFHGHYHRYYRSVSWDYDSPMAVIGLDCDATTLDSNTLFID